MTPEKAQGLRERATPGPWERHPDNPRMLCNLERKFAVHAELLKYRGLEPDPEDVANTALIAATPALAGLVAGMRVEYAVQYFFHGEWQDTRYRRDTKQEAELVRDLYPQYDTRVVRRLTTEWEEAE